MKWNVGTKIGAGFALTVAIFVIVGTVSYHATGELIEDSNARKRSYEVLLKIERVLTQLDAVVIGQRSYFLTGDETYLQAYQAAMGRLQSELPELRQLVVVPEQRQRLEALIPVLKARLDMAGQAVDVYRSQGADAALQIVRAGRGEALSADVRKRIDEFISAEDKLLEQRINAAQADSEKARLTIILGTFAALVLSILAGLLLTRSIARPLQALTAVAERITLGDLNVNVAADTRSDEVGMLARAFSRMTLSLRTMADAAEQIAGGDLRSNVKPQSADDVLGNAFARMAGDLREQIRGLNDGAAALGSAASEIVASTSQLATSASQSAAAVSETTTTVEEVRQTAQLASQKAKLVSDTAQKAAETAQNGRKSAEELRGGMNRIRQQMEAIAASMLRLAEQSHAIGQIIATVEDLAAQSNLLAVNAAIEAAKAGEHGKGFGVVAQEVKSLAEQSRQATNQVRTILGDIQKATTAAVMATEEGSKAVEGGTRQTDIAGGAIQALSAGVNEAAQAATQIAASSQQQLVGVDQVAGAMESIKQASTQNVASAKQLESAARNLNDLGQRLRQMVERYQV